MKRKPQTLRELLEEAISRYVEQQDILWDEGVRQAAREMKEIEGETEWHRSLKAS